MTAPRTPHLSRLASRFRGQLRARGVEAPLRIAGALALDAVAATGALADPLRGAERRQRRRAARRSARLLRWVRVAGALKGAFAKAGQFASLRYDVLEPGARAALDSLQDRCPPLPFATIRRLLERELGGPIDAHFAELAAEPIGAASIAQVHAGRLLDGTPVAVKVLYPWIEAAMPHDLRLLRRALRWFTRGADDFDRLFGEFADGLAGELDFELEARSARAIAANLSNQPGVIVPTIYDAQSTRRVLTMSRHDGVRIDDGDAFDKLGIDRRRIVEILAHAYGQQVFADGLFHADPHPGNLFLVAPDGPDADLPRVLFVDFGLCKQLEPTLRQALREAILAVLQKDPTAFVDRMEQMGMIAAGARPEVERRVAGMFERITGAGGALALSGGQVLGIKDEAKQLLAETPGLQLPNDLLLYARTLSYLFALCERIEPSVDVMKISVPFLLKFLAQREAPAPEPTA